MHFFTEPALLNAQAAADAFGPINNDKYHVSSKHSVSSKAKIFACQNAMMLVQPHVDVSTGTTSTSLVNLVLKPIEGLGIKFPPVKYYIYRGVDKNSLISGTAIIPSGDSNATEFSEKFWQNWNDFKTNTNQPGLTDPTPQSFGYDPSLVGSTDLLEEYFNSAESSNTTINDFQAIRVSEGEWIASLTNGPTIEFEIVTDKDHLVCSLEYAQKSVAHVDATGLVALALQAARQKVLNYIDPAAFFGMHHTQGVDIASYTGTTKNPPIRKRELALFTDVIAQFKNESVVWLDVRNENGYSYFYHENYQNPQYSGATLLGIPCMSLKSQSATLFNDLDYVDVYWPLVNLSSPPFALVPLVPGEKIDMKLSVNKNNKPVVYAENPELFGPGNTNNFIDPDTLITPGYLVLPTYTETFTVETPKVDDSGTIKNVAHHIRLQYFRTDYSEVIHPGVMKTGFWLDAAYGGVLQPELNTPTPFQHLTNSKRHLVHKEGEFSFVANNGFYVDTTRVLFYAENTASRSRSGNVYPPFDITSVPPADVDGILSRRNTVYNKFTIDDAGTSVEALAIVGYNRTSEEATPQEDLLMLGLEQSDLTLISALTSFSDLQHLYFSFEEVLGTGGSPLTDATTGAAFRKFKPKVRGLDSSGPATEVDTFPPLTGPIEVYGSNANFLCTPAFAASTSVALDLPDPGVMTEFSLTHRFDYDSQDPFVDTIISGGLLTIPDATRTGSGLTIDVGLNGEIHFPIENPGDTTIHPGRPSYPLILLSHANGGRYTNYRQLAEFLAKNGFIVAVMSSLKNTGPGSVALLDPGALTSITFSPAFPADYYVAFGGSLDTIYVYYNGTAAPLAGYGFEQFSALEFTVATVGTSQTVTITDQKLLPWTKGTEFDITPSTGTPSFVTFRVDIGTHGMDILGRVNMMYPHLQIIQEKFGNKVEKKFGLLGHSRGGEAVVRAGQTITTTYPNRYTSGSLGTRSSPEWENIPDQLDEVACIMSLAPTDDWSPQQDLTNDIPYYVLYGSMDGDVAGYQKASAPNRNTGFSLLDRAVNQTEKAMSFVHGATHNGFITNNKDYNPAKFSTYAPTLLDPSMQKKIMLAYTNAYFRMHLRGEDMWRPMFQGEYIPRSVNFGEMYPQYRNMRPGEFDTIVNFQSAGNIGTGIGEVEHSAGAGNLTEGDLIDLDPHTPHDSKGLRVDWSASDELTIRVSASGKDVTNYTHLSFRIGHRADISPGGGFTSFIQTGAAFDTSGRRIFIPDPPLVDHDAQVIGAFSSLNDLAVRLSDGTTSYTQPAQKIIPEPWEREVRVNIGLSLANAIDDKGTSTITDDERDFEYRSLTKSAMMTIRVPLSEYGNNGVNLTQVRELVIVFPGTGSGQVMIDDIEFTK